MREWVHGSPERLTELRKGSTITIHRQLARVFSHKPAIVVQEDNGTIRHTGKEFGYLYHIAEPLDELRDVTPHPRTTMGKDQEWLTERTLQLLLLEEVGYPAKDELLSEQEVEELWKRGSGNK